MDFKDCLLKQFNKHPSMRPQDVVKLCYQAALGAEHLLADVDGARRYFNSEFEGVEPRDGDLLELISPDVARIDLGVWKTSGMPKEWLFNIFVASAGALRGDKEDLDSYLKIAEDCFENAHPIFDRKEWEGFIEQYIALGMPALHHSKEYRDAEKPSYRIIDSRFLTLLPILERASMLKASDGARVISIDGRAASGKSTLAELLSKALYAQKIHMDDFFLPPELRSEERLNEIGGNIHYERFAKEVLPSIRSKSCFSYRVFDCSQMKMGGERRIEASDWRIVEGSYSHHPSFGEYADIRVFVTVSSETQMGRIIVRNGEKMAEMFKDRWIPMEEVYFNGKRIKENADIVISTEA